MDSSWVRLGAQIALTTWAMTEIAILLCTRNRMAVVTGTRWAITGLCCFAAWMFLSSISIHAVALVSRGNLVIVFAALEMGAAVGAWGWLASNAREKFRIITK